ncbi:MAG: ATP-dependent protease ATPase subunit HslU [Chloroflexota bacterium]|nr:MAG: ATP-dependent protease ATPase subunit HslU [Chloroflexota bacterium]
MATMKPRDIVAALDKYIVGQQDAKRAVAVAICNRQRRRQLAPDVAKDITPKNILLIGPTGVGKTEVARRVAGIIDAPFVKVEATKFTEVGYVGRDVDSIIQDLVEASVSRVHEEKLVEVEKRAEDLATEKIVTYLCQQEQTAACRVAARGTATAEARAEAVSPRGADPVKSERRVGQLGHRATPAKPRVNKRDRERVTTLLNDRKLEDHLIEIEVSNSLDSFDPVVEFSAGMSADEMTDTFNEFIDSYQSFSTRRRYRKVSVKEARRILTREEANKLIDFDQVVETAIQRMEESGMVFIDELDKICGAAVETGADVSGEGVQRDLLPLVEGCTVLTRYGPVKTDHVLFIAAGAFHQKKPSDLIPELQGRFPLRVELQSLGEEELRRILAEPHNSLTKQYQALMSTEGVQLEFTPGAIESIAHFAAQINARTENIGARRLQTVTEKLLEELSFTASDHTGETVAIDERYVTERLANLVHDEDLSKYIL